jgi:ABC-type transporter Mla subunit MlaD
VTNTELLNAIDAVPAVGALCEQAEDLTDQTTDLGGTLASLNTVLDTLLLGFSPIEVPTALPSFSCPN